MRRYHAANMGHDFALGHLSCYCGLEVFASTQEAPHADNLKPLRAWGCTAPVPEEEQGRYRAQVGIPVLAMRHAYDDATQDARRACRDALRCAS